MACTGLGGTTRPAPVFLSPPQLGLGCHLLCFGMNTGTRVRWLGLWPSPFHPDWTLGHHHPAPGCTAPWDPLGIWFQRGPDPQESGQSWPPGPSWPAEARADITAHGEVGRARCPHQQPLPGQPQHWLALSLKWTGLQAAPPGPGASSAQCRILGCRAIYLAFCPASLPLAPAHISTSGKAALYAHPPPAFPPVLTPSDWQGP